MYFLSALMDFLLDLQEIQPMISGFIQQKIDIILKIKAVLFRHLWIMHICICNKIIRESFGRDST